MRTCLRTLFVVVVAFLETVTAAKVTVKNDGPAVRGAPITFYAELDHAYDYYIYEFQDMHDFTQKDVSGYEKAKATFIFAKRPASKNYRMAVRVWFTIFGNKAWIVDKTENVFELDDYLIGSLKLSQDDTAESTLSRSIVAANRTANVSVNLYDPSKFLEGFNMTYSWEVDEIHGNETIKNISAVFSYNFTSPSSLVTVMVTAESVPKNMTMSGRFLTNITAKGVIRDLSVSGKTWITRDRSLDLNASCVGGDPPYSFCRKVFFDNATASKNFSCPEFHVLSDKCRFPVSWYFRNSGTYYVIMQSTNDVSTVTKKFEINVVDINKQAQLSFVIIPVVSSILAIIIVMVGLAYHLQQRQRYTVEVADFDFQHNENLDEKTFLERVKESFSASFATAPGAGHNRGLNGGGGTAYEGFINDDDEFAPDVQPRLIQQATFTASA